MICVYYFIKHTVWKIKSNKTKDSVVVIVIKYLFRKKFVIEIERERQSHTHLTNNVVSIRKFGLIEN